MILMLNSLVCAGLFARSFANLARLIVPSLRSEHSCKKRNRFRESELSKFTQMVESGLPARQQA